MDVRYCKNCGQIFQYTNSPLCNKCRREMEEKFSSVKEYIRENPQAKIGEISDECDVPLPQIKRWIREERLAFSEDSGIALRCEKCGAPILTGRYCRECKKNMTQRLSSAYPEESKKKGQKIVSGEGKMRFLGK